VIKDPDQWKMHSLVNSRYLRDARWLGDADFLEIKSDNEFFKIEDEYNDIYGKLTLALLFDQSITFGDICELVSPKEEEKVKKRNFRAAVKNVYNFHEIGGEMSCRSKNFLIDPLDLLPTTHYRYLPLITEKLPGLVLV